MESNPYNSPSANLFGSSSQTTTEAVPAEAISQLQRTKPWTRVIGVVTWLVVGLMVLGGAGFAVFALAGLASANTGAAEKGMMVGMAIAYVVMGFLYIYPAIKIWSYGSAIRNLMNSRSPEDLVKALDQQRSLWKFAGILTIILIIVYAVAIIAMIGLGVAAGAGALKGLPGTPQ